MKLKPVVIIILAVALVSATAAWPYIKMEFASSAYYSQTDKREYEYYTPELLKKMPRISSSFTFQYMSNHDSRSALHGVRFEGTTETDELKTYLRSSGYKPQATCDTSAECWHKEGSSEIVSLYSSSVPDYVVLQVSTH